MLKIDQIRKTEIIVAFLFIIATLSGVLSVVTLQSIVDDPEDITNIADNENQVIFGAILDLITGIAVAGIGFMIYPILKKQNEGLALGYVVFRIIEGIILIIGSITLLILTSLSQEYVEAGAPEDSFFQSLSILLLEAYDWTFLLGPVIIFSITALILNYLFYQSKLVPRFISIWGFIGAILLLIAGLAGMFEIGDVYVGVPVIAVNEMVLAGWLIVKGFNPSVINTRSVEINEGKR